MNWQDLLCNCTSINPRRQFTRSEWPEHLTRTQRTTTAFQITVIVSANMRWHGLLESCVTARSAQVCGLNAVNIWPSQHCHLLIVNASSLCHSNTINVFWDHCQRQRVKYMIYIYIKWCNIEHSVRWTYSRRTVVSIIQGNVITNLSTRVVQFCHKQRSSRVCFYWYSHFARVRDFSNSTPQIGWTQLGQRLPWEAGHIECLDNKPILN